MDRVIRFGLDDWSITEALFTWNGENKTECWIWNENNNNNDDDDDDDNNNNDDNNNDDNNNNNNNNSWK